MYINDVIRLVRNYYPSEYDLAEMYLWCDEVSSMLTIEDRQTYREKQLPVSSDGTILLPEGVNIDYVDRIIYKNIVLKKQDARTAGKKYINIKGCNGFVEHENERASPGDVVTVIYLQPYEPIRLVKYNGRITVEPESDCMWIDTCEFIPGDTLIVKADTVSGTKVPLFDVKYDSSSESPHKLICSSDSLSEFYNMVYDDGSITRYVTDKTVCDAPFDGMYVDYLLAKINLYQRDMNTYNQHITLFNSRLAAYKSWLAERCTNDDCNLINWW